MRATLVLQLLGILRWVTAKNPKNPKDNFCRRFAHQTTVIGDKLYIDGGWVNFDDFQKTGDNISNTWLAYHDLNNPILKNDELWPALNISLRKNNSIPSVNGGILWGDEVNKRFYLYGGEWNTGIAQWTYHLVSYDILHDKWDDFGAPDLNPPPKIASYGAGVGVSATGMGYYLGGWISQASMNGWKEDRTMSSSFYTYAYDTGKFTQAASPDKHPRAEGGMVWIPFGDELGLLVYMGGIFSSDGNNTEAPQSFEEVFVYDPKGNSWWRQKTTGEIPQNRRQFCVDVAWAPDKSTFNIYLWGGLSVPPPVVNATSFADIYILSLPSFIWVKAYPDHHGNATLPPEYGHYSASCNVVKSMSQLFVIGGTYPDTDACDLAYEVWALHSFWTGTYQNAGNSNIYWSLYDPTVTTNAVPEDVYNVTGGNKNGGATLKAPKAGFDSGNKDLEALLGRKASIPERFPTCRASCPTSSPTATPDSRPVLSTGAIVGIAIGGAVVLVVALTVWFCIGRRIVRWREKRYQAEPSYFGGSQVAPSSTLSPSPRFELPEGNVISELPQQTMRT